MLGAYAQYWRINLLTMLEYRANFIMWFVFTIVYHGVALGALFVTMERFPSMNGWNFRDVFFLYALWMCGHELHNTLFFTVVSVPEYVREGRFDRFLVRPLDTLFQVLTVPAANRSRWVDSGNRHARGRHACRGRARGLGLRALRAGDRLRWSADRSWASPLAIATCSFWFVRVDTLRWVVMSLEQDFTRYPISIYGRGVQIVLAFVLPFAFMNYFPATYFLQKAETGLHLNPAVGLLTPAIGLAWLGAAYAFWIFGLRHYQGTGS